MPNFKYLFGPVPSRRFGLSLGVDLIPRKTCTQDCIFCEVGPTTHRTLERKEYVPTEEVLEELAAWFALNLKADFVTVTGSGEPTLHTRFAPGGVPMREARSGSRHADKSAVLAMLARRPCTVEDVVHAFALSREEVAVIVRKLIAEHAVRKEVRNGETYYAGGQEENDPGSA